MPESLLRSIVLSFLLLGATGCMAPRYVRPALPVAEAWPEAPPAVEADAADWRSAFLDPALQGLVERALANNRSLRDTALAIEQAGAQLRVTASALGPSVDLGASYRNQRTPASVSPVGQGFTIGQFSVGPTVSWELDLFGRVLEQRSSAEEALLAAGEDWRAARLALIASVAEAALQERVLAQRLLLAEQALERRVEAAHIVELQLEAGLVSDLDREQARALVAAAEVARAQLRRAVGQAHNALVLLVGEPVELLPPSGPELDGVVALSVPAGVPSQLLERRPDIRAAEHRLMATHADIGAARAAFFPQVSLSAGVNLASPSLPGLFDPAALAWTLVAPSISQSLFAWGRKRAQLQGTKVGRARAIAAYERAVQVAFREVSDVLVAWPTRADEVAAQEQLLAAQVARVELASQLYGAGASGYLQVLDAERERFQAEQSLMTARLDRALLAVAWFKVLGGGAEGLVDLPPEQVSRGPLRVEVEERP